MLEKLFIKYHYWWLRSFTWVLADCYSVSHTVLDHWDHIKAQIWQDDMLVGVAAKIIEGSLSAE